MNKLRITKIFLPAVALTAILQACSSPGARETNKDAGDKAVVQEVFSLQKGALSSSLQIPGELIAWQQVDLYAKVNSFIKKLYVDIGDEVKTGQLLALMEAPELSSQLTGAESRLKAREAVYLASKATYSRLLETSKTPGTVSQNDLDMALAKQNSDLAQLEAAKAAYREIGDNKNYLQIRAPFNGIISARNVSTGAYVGPSGKGSELPVFTLQEQKKLRLTVSFPEAYSGTLNNKGRVNFTVKALPGETFTAHISRLSGALDSRLRSQRIEMDIDNTGKRLLPGMVAEVTIPVGGETETFVVPSKAVLNSTQGVFVIKVVNNKAKWIPVRTGRQNDDKTEIFGDLVQGDLIVKAATEEIRDGAGIKAVKAGAI